VAVGVAYGLFAPTMMWLALLLSGCSGLLFGQLMVTTRYVAFVRGLFAERGDGVSTAASIAAIIKGSHAASVPALARQHFRGVRICDLTLDALSGNAADANANAISRHANLGARDRARRAPFRVRAPRARAAQRARRPRLSVRAMPRPALAGEVDAFVTHSWSDDAAAKLRALRGWRAQFMALNRREPLVWCAAAPPPPHATRAGCTARTRGPLAPFVHTARCARVAPRPRRTAPAQDRQVLPRPARDRRRARVLAGLPRRLRQPARARGAHVGAAAVVRDGDVRSL
jgi:hypothetical protein